jgi:hypothetical protein
MSGLGVPLGSGVVLAVCVVLACSAGSGSERRGDQAYGAARYREALAEYQEAVKSEPAARVWAKIGAAALRANEAGTAADAYLRLAGEDPTRADEAAEGLELAARSAERADNIRALHAAVTGLEAVAPERVAGRLALMLARQPKVDPADLVPLLPSAIAAASDPRTVDSLLGTYAAALRETAGCGAAVPVFRAVLRRSREQGLLDAAGAGIVACTDTAAVAEPLPARDSTVDSMRLP